MYTRCVLALIALYVGLAQSWDIAATNGELLEFYCNGTKIHSVRFDGMNLTALVYAQTHSMMLFIDKQSNNDVICGYDTSSMEKKCFTERSGRNIHGLAFDPVTDKLFFSDTIERSISSISLKHGFVNNTHVTHLLGTGDGIPTDLAVDSCRGYVYWINTNLTSPTITRARLDGSDKEVIITSVSINKLEPNSLVIDQQTQRMYWMEPRNSLIYNVNSANLNGNSKEAINFISWSFPRHMIQPSASILTVSNTSLYLVGWCSDCELYVWGLPKTVSKVKYYGLFQLHTVGSKGGIVANYKIEVNIPEIEDCEPLKSLVRNNCDGPFCVRGMQNSGLPECR